MKRELYVLRLVLGILVPFYGFGHAYGSEKLAISRGEKWPFLKRFPPESKSFTRPEPSEKIAKKVVSWPKIVERLHQQRQSLDHAKEERSLAEGEKKYDGPRLDPFPFKLRMPESPLALSVLNSVSFLNNKPFKHFSNLKMFSVCNTLSANIAPIPELDLIGVYGRIHSHYRYAMANYKGKSVSQLGGAGFGYRFGNRAVFYIDCAWGTEYAKDRQVMNFSGKTLTATFHRKARITAGNVIGSFNFLKFSKAIWESKTILGIQGSFWFEQKRILPFQEVFSKDISVNIKEKKMWAYLGDVKIFLSGDILRKNWEILPFCAAGVGFGGPETPKTLYNISLSPESAQLLTMNPKKISKGESYQAGIYSFTAFRGAVGVLGNWERISFMLSGTVTASQKVKNYIITTKISYSF